LVAVAPERTVKGGVAAGLAVAAVLITSCGQAVSDPVALLASAQEKTNRTPSLHFHISSDSEPASPGHPHLVSADGDMVRPDGFTGSLKVETAGVLLSVDLVATGGRFWVRLPFSTQWTSADPRDYGFNDPGVLLDTKTGLTVLLDSPLQIEVLGNDRLQGEELNEIRFQVSGTQIANIFPGGDAKARDEVTAGIAVGSGELRRLVITGPIVAAGRTSTFTIVLSRYGEGVKITPAN
jgi:lipoprotein LprG